MKFFLLQCLFLLLALFSIAQEKKVEQLKQELEQHQQPDSFRVNRLNNLVLSYDMPPDEIEKLAGEALTISRRIGYQPGEGYALINLGHAKNLMGEVEQAEMYLAGADSLARKIGDKELLVISLIEKGSLASRAAGNRNVLAHFMEAEKIAQENSYPKLLAISQRMIGEYYENTLSDHPNAMEYNLKAMATSEKAKDQQELGKVWENLATLYSRIDDKPNSLLYFKKAAKANHEIGNKSQEGVIYTNIGEHYRLAGQYKEAIESYKQALLLAGGVPYSVELNQSNLADVYTRMDSLSLGFKYAFSSHAIATEIGDKIGVAWINGILSRLYLKKGMADSAIYYSRLGLEAANETQVVEYMRDNAGVLAQAYAFKKDFEKAYEFQLLYTAYRDSIFNTDARNKSLAMKFNYDLDKKQSQITLLNQQKRIQRDFLISVSVVLLLIIVTAVILYRSNRHKQQANKMLIKQKQEIETQRDQIDSALTELKETQKQLIQSEKMASLGELTAGIAHEIQNPLNFVNNFSDVNKELLSEMKEEMKKGNLTDAMSIAGDVIDNEEKINHHGKRADAIVKGMLQHSRAGTGQKEPTDINALADEHLRLAYHAFRAKDKSFNIKIETDFDPGIGKINVVPQDMGRVLLNLINNAFYAATLSVQPLTPGAGSNKIPIVTVTTKKYDGGVALSVMDNGPGIPASIIDKIFQPFFTTKPTGQGTGLGLSLSYDVVTKGHGGELLCETTEGLGTEFIVKLPLR